MAQITRRRLIGASAASVSLLKVRGVSAATALRPDPLVVDDQSGLNPTRAAVNAVVGPSAELEIEAGVRGLLADAARGDRPFCVGGARHSMGGQSLPPEGGYAVEIRDPACQIDEGRSSYRVEAGARWREVIAGLDRYGLSPAVTQSNNDFSVGGALSVNAHGWAAPHGPVASTVKSFRLLLADGSIVRCSPADNVELFRHVLGGYGLFGVMLDVELACVPNLMLEPSRHVFTASEFAERFVQAVRAPEVRMAYGRLSLMRDRFLQRAILTTYRPAARQPDPLPAAHGQGAVGELSRAIFRGQTGSDVGKQLRWRAETELSSAVAGPTTRNSLLDVPVAALAGWDRRRTDILHEYFVPPDALDTFLSDCRRWIAASRQDLLNVTLRWVEPDRLTALAFAPEPRIAAVMFFSQEKTVAAEADMRDLTRSLIDAALSVGGSFYLPYRLHARPDQLLKAYPGLPDFAAAKRRWDPKLRFRNQMWDAWFAHLA
jgi:FAD/FMN-containing dehydrogenase